MSRRQLRLLNLSVRAFPRDRRERDGIVIRDLAVEMVESGKSVGGQAGSLVTAGLAARIRGVGSLPSVELTRQAFLLLAGLVAPLLILTVFATLAATLFADATLPNNRLATGFSLSPYWLIHAGAPWVLSIGGCVVAAFGFSAGSRHAARLGSLASFVGAWLVIGSMGGWMPGSGFVGPAIMPMGQGSATDLVAIYVIAPIGAIAAVMLVASLLMKPRDIVPAPRLDPTRIGAMVAVGFIGFGIAYASSDRLTGLLTSMWMGLFIFLPFYCAVFRLTKLPAGVRPMAFGIGLAVFAIPSVLVFSQWILSRIVSQDWLEYAVAFSAMALLSAIGTTTMAISLFRSRRRA